MTRGVGALVVCGLLSLGSFCSVANAQQAVTITGHVSASGSPVRGASVRIAQLDLGTTTDADGRYSFIVPSSRVRGQSVTIVARYLRNASKSAEVVLVGGSLTQDFDLTALPETPSARPDRPRTTDSSRTGVASAGPPNTTPSNNSPDASTGISRRLNWTMGGSSVDSTVLTEISGSVDLPGALVGRIAGLDVQSASTFGGTSPMTVRGPHTIVGLSQPLIVVNGLVIDNSNITTAAQRAGLGGFDYGSAVNDLNLEDIASVQLLAGSSAAMQFGGRAANGVLLITTKSAHGLNGMEVAASQQVSYESILRLPNYQNDYGQGLGGKFSFWDGKGGGINDSVSQSWGPALNGIPLTQASLGEAGRPDVRGWFAQPNNVSDYFQQGRTLITNASLLSGGESRQFRIAFSDRTGSGTTPLSTSSRKSAVATGGATPWSRLTLSGDVQLYADHADNRPGTGFDESNPVSVFSHMPRQVDVLTYETVGKTLRDANGVPISWNYSGHDNPWFAALLNSNSDHSSRYVAGGSATLVLKSWLTAIAHVGADHSSDTRAFTVASGWMGGFPDYLGRGDFSAGGNQSTDITVTQTSGDIALRATPATSGPMSFAFTAGLGSRGDNLQTSVAGSDVNGTGTTAIAADWWGNLTTRSVFAGVETNVSDFAFINLKTRTESGSLLSGTSTSTTYPAITAGLDLLRLRSGGSSNGKFQALTIHGGWYRSGNETDPATLQQLGIASVSADSLVARVASPELTTGWDAGASMAMLQNRLALDVDYYNERSTNLLLAAGSGAARTGTISNKGIEASINLVPIRVGDNFEWRVAFTVSKNTNLLESMSDGSTSVDLSPSFSGVTVQARTGYPLGAIVGNRFLRDTSGALVLSSGHPLADSAAGPQVLGSGAPNWIGGLTSTVRIRGVEFSVLFDTHQGGQIFSASNLSGAYSGVLAETAFRPDTGLLIAGVDKATGNPNSTHVTTEDYYHSLGPIGERWVYDASFVKLREARVSFSLPLQFVSFLRAQSLRASLIGRNLVLWSKAPNIDPETALSSSTLRGVEMGQLPTARSVGFQVSVTP